MALQGVDFVADRAIGFQTQVGDFPTLPVVFVQNPEMLFGFVNFYGTGTAGSVARLNAVHARGLDCLERMRMLIISTAKA